MNQKNQQLSTAARQSEPSNAIANKFDSKSVDCKTPSTTELYFCLDRDQYHNLAMLFIYTYIRK